MNLVIVPPLPVITLADTFPYNNYTLQCNASLPPDFQLFHVNITWLDTETDNQIQPNNSVFIHTVSSPLLLNDQEIIVYSSSLTVMNVRNGTYRRACRADMGFVELVNDEPILRMYPGIVTANRTIIVRGE